MHLLAFLLAFLGGALTILSPCVLPVIPFVFARSDRPFLKSGLFTLLGMAVTFAALASVATIGGGWIVQANQVGRGIAMVLLGVLGLSMLLPSVGDFLTRPLVALGGRLQGHASQGDGGPGSSMLVGVAIGFLWAPCAGPILGLILTSAALSGASITTTLLLFSFAAGAATSLGLATLAGARVFRALKGSLGAEVWIRKGLGAAALLGVIAVALGWDKGILTALSLGSTNQIEERLVERFAGGPQPVSGGSVAAGEASAAPGQLPDLSGATGWLNTAPLSASSLRGHVVLIDVWTYSCINCLRTLPYVKTWAERYESAGLVIIGVHSPEFAFERDPDNVRKAVRDLGIRYPVALDDKFAIWRALDNKYWPAQYLIDTSGTIVYRGVGEGHEPEMEQRIRALLAASGRVLPAAAGESAGDVRGALAPRGTTRPSPETYLGYSRARNFSSPHAIVRDAEQAYTWPDQLPLDGWGLRGVWTVGAETAVGAHTGTAIKFRYRGRDLHLVMGPAVKGEQIRFRVRLDGAPIKDARGSDIMLDGTGMVTSERLYQLVRSSADAKEHTFEIEFLDPGVAVYAFTFG